MLELSHLIIANRLTDGKITQDLSNTFILSSISHFCRSDLQCAESTIIFDQESWITGTDGFSIFEPFNLSFRTVQFALHFHLPLGLSFLLQLQFLSEAINWIWRFNF